MSAHHDMTELSIRLLDKNYQIKCPIEQQEALYEAAKFLDEELRRTRKAGIVGLDRITMITALNIVNDFLHIRNEKDSYTKSLSERMRELQTKIDDALTSAEQLELE